MSIKRICTICARSGSKGLKNKNILDLCGKPLLAHSIMQAKESELFDAVAVSSDSKEILEIGKKWGADYLIVRPPELATDECSKIPAIRHCVLEVEKIATRTYDIIVDLQPTSPLRLPEDIRNAVRAFEMSKASNLITGSPSKRSPYCDLVEVDARGVARLSKPMERSIFRRQDSPQCYDMNGSIYIWRRDALFRTKETVFLEDTTFYVMPEERSVDIDTELDFEIAEFLMTEREKSKQSNVETEYSKSSYYEKGK